MAVHVSLLRHNVLDPVFTIVPAQSLSPLAVCIYDKPLEPLHLSGSRAGRGAQTKSSPGLHALVAHTLPGLSKAALIPDDRGDSGTGGREVV